MNSASILQIYMNMKRKGGTAWCPYSLFYTYRLNCSVFSYLKETQDRLKMIFFVSSHFLYFKTNVESFFFDFLCPF